MSDASRSFTWVSVGEVAEMLGVSVWTVRNWTQSENRGPPFYRIGRSVRFKHDEVLDWLEQRRQVGAS